jgi:multidrug efflux system outer membrane protein
MNARRCTLLLVTAGSLVLAGCALKNPPFGADIMPERTRAKIPGSWAGPHRSGTVVPNWIRNFGDPELNALVADAVERNPDLKAAAARVEASRAAVLIALPAYRDERTRRASGTGTWWRHRSRH